MRSSVSSRVLASILALFLVVSSGCETTTPSGPDGGTPNGGTPDGGTPDDGATPDGTSAALIKTAIVQDTNRGRIEAGDDLIVYANNGSIFYFVPSTATEVTNAGTEIPQGGLFGSRDFKAAGKKVALVRDSTFRMAIFDTQTGTLTDIPGTDITLDRFVIPTDVEDPGHIMADGSLVATINDGSAVTGNGVIRVIDTSVAVPTVITFPTPASFAGSFDQVAIDAGTRRVAAHGDNPDERIFVFNVDNPSAAPLDFDVFAEGFQDAVQMQFDGDYIIYAQGTSDRRALLNVSTGVITPFTANPSNPTLPVAVASGSFGFFMAEAAADMTSDTLTFRSVIGQVANAPTATTAAQAVAVGSDSSCASGGMVGYGRTIGILPDGSKRFIAGLGPVSTDTAHLQMSTGGAFTTFRDPDDESQTGTVMASDVSCSSNTVAFRALRQVQTSGCLTNDTEVIAFIVVGRL